MGSQIKKELIVHLIKDLFQAEIKMLQNPFTGNKIGLFTIFDHT